MFGGMQIAELWRYPVKSLQGERLDAVAVTADGLEGDRQFAIYDVESGLGLTGRRVPELLFASARLRADGTAQITLPDGSLAGDDNTLSDWLGRSVTLRSAATEAARRYENVVDFEHESTSAWEPFDGAARAFHDNPSARVSLVSTATIGSWDPRRFRANVLLDGEGEDGLVGSRVTLGEATLTVEMRIERCVMTTRAQAGGIERDLDVLRRIARERDACLAVGALVIDQGTIRVGDTLGAN
jgi:MOSC domain-containing protein